MREFGANPIEAEFESLPDTEKFERLLNLFGTVPAKLKFLKLCEDYNDIRTQQRAAEIAQIENYKPKKNVEYSTPKRAQLHNAIMDTLKRLSLGRNISDLDQKILREMASREYTSKLIHEWLAIRNKEWDPESEDDHIRQIGNRSDVAKFHYLSKYEKED